MEPSTRKIIGKFSHKSEANETLVVLAERNVARQLLMSETPESFQSERAERAGS